MNTTETYIVVRSQEKWWIDLDGRSTGPFTNLDIAVASAVASAGSSARLGKRSEVRVVEGGVNRIVFQSAARSALSRAHDTMVQQLAAAE